MYLMNVETKNCWSDDWRSKMLDALCDRGFRSATEFLKYASGETYVNLSRQLGDFAPHQLETLQFEEASKSGQVRTAAKDALVRILRDRLKRGWKIGKHVGYNTASAFAAWKGCPRLSDAQNEALADHVWKAMEQAAPPTGWLPGSIDDPII
jgi:hypothetical protein